MGRSGQAIQTYSQGTRRARRRRPPPHPSTEVRERWLVALPRAIGVPDPCQKRRSSPVGTLAAPDGTPHQRADLHPWRLEPPVPWTSKLGVSRCLVLSVASCGALTNTLPQNPHNTQNRCRGGVFAGHGVLVGPSEAGTHNAAESAETTGIAPRAGAGVPWRVPQVRR